MYPVVGYPVMSWEILHHGNGTRTRVPLPCTHGCPNLMISDLFILESILLENILCKIARVTDRSGINQIWIYMGTFSGYYNRRLLHHNRYSRNISVERETSFRRRKLFPLPRSIWSAPPERSNIFFQ